MAIKVLGICATPVKGETNTEILLQATLDATRQGADDVETELVCLGEKKIQSGCVHCNWCLQRQTADKFCAFNDDMSNEIYSKVVDADALIVATPVYIARLSWLAASFMDRLRALAEGRYYGIRGPLGGVLKEKVFGACSVAWIRHAGVETAQLSLIQGAFIFDMIVVSGGFQYGAGGVSAAPLGQTGAVRNDRFGIGTAQILGRRVIEVTRTLKAGREALRYIPAYIT